MTAIFAIALVGALYDKRPFCAIVVAAKGVPMFLDDKADGEPYQAPTAPRVPPRLFVATLLAIAAAAFCGNVARGYDLSMIEGPALVWWDAFKLFTALALAFILVAAVRCRH
jgi:hypothetical protein